MGMQFISRKNFNSKKINRINDRTNDISKCLREFDTVCGSKLAFHRKLDKSDLIICIGWLKRTVLKIFN